jgi:hypothetical protein
MDSLSDIGKLHNAANTNFNATLREDLALFDSRRGMGRAMLWNGVNRG